MCAFVYVHLQHVHLPSNSHCMILTMWWCSMTYWHRLTIETHHRHRYRVVSVLLLSSSRVEHLSVCTLACIVPYLDVVVLSMVCVRCALLVTIINWQFNFIMIIVIAYYWRHCAMAPHTTPLFDDAKPKPNSAYVCVDDSTFSIVFRSTNNGPSTHTNRTRTLWFLNIIMRFVRN